MENSSAQSAARARVISSFESGRKEGRDPGTLIKAESWICSYCDTVQEKRSQEAKPTEEMMIIRRLLKLSGDYDQIQHSSLEVEGDIVTLRLKFLPWKVVLAARRVEEAKKKGFFRLGDLWRLEQHGILEKSVGESAGFCASPRQQPGTGSSANSIASNL